LLCGTSLARAIQDELSHARPFVQPRHNVGKVSSIGRSINNNNNNNINININNSNNNGGFWSSITSSVSASVGVSMNLADVSARGATEVAHNAFVEQEEDPVVRYSLQCARLVLREFSLARAKRDGLTIVQLSNQFRLKFPQLTKSKISETAKANVF
jgi:hypothetical protein